MEGCSLQCLLKQWLQLCVLIGRRAAMIPAADVQQQDVSFTRLHIHLTAGAKRAVINRVI